ncbi:histidine phosphatase family protein [Brevibacillus humidisoli]|uniref:histidine phosphatase family protein n=1 Tax=Brevibacillus humidisoli TaxID=2895522 RepID=UPI001E2AA90B|nr:histidine phosphatase family protein [Brevibacillus humidisoli]UFJ41563.1 histidine phosphatase family protein [Brevibacillus humidisoli]
METILYMIRHGETEWNRIRRIQGHSDLQLTATGERQADRLAKRFAGKAISAVYSSDLQRASETARRLAEAVGQSVHILPALRERNFGKWEGLTREEIEERYQDSNMNEAKYGIESFAAMQKRAMECLTTIAEVNLSGTVAVVSHGGLINSFLHFITNGTLGTGVTQIDNTGVSTVRYRSGQWEVLHVNDTEHLQEPPLFAG